MSKSDEYLPEIYSKVGKLQERFVNSKALAPANHLQWGQFLVAPSPGATTQVGVYGSSCAVLVLRASQTQNSPYRDDAAARDAQASLQSYIATPQAELELGHNIKLALVVLALAPCGSEDASPEMLKLLDELLARRSTSQQWSAYNPPAALAAFHYVKGDSVVATAAIVIFLCGLLHRMKNQKYFNQLAIVEGVVKASAEQLDSTFRGKDATSKRFGALISTAVILALGNDASRTIKRAYADAVRTRDFSERRVFFYDCLKENGTLTRDFFILPPAVVLPLVAGNAKASSSNRAGALAVAPELIAQLDADGTFKAGQDMPSTVEQALVALSLQAVVRAHPNEGASLAVSKAWLGLTRPSENGTPTWLVTTTVILLWVATAAVNGGKFIPDAYQHTQGLSAIYRLGAWCPDALSSFLVFLCGAWPTSRQTFLRPFGWSDK